MVDGLAVLGRAYFRNIGFDDVSTVVVEEKK